MDDLIGRTFYANINGYVIVMRVEKVIMSIAYCKSLCLRYTTELFTDVVYKQLEREENYA